MAKAIIQQQVDELLKEVNKRLALSGGRMDDGASLAFSDGAVYAQRTETAHGILVLSDNKEGRKGAFLDLRNVDSPTGAGCSYLFTMQKDGTVGPALALQPSGDFSWDGKPVIRIVESWNDGSSWYRVYSDGWIEQGGQITDINVSGYATITFMKPFTLQYPLYAGWVPGRKTDAYPSVYNLTCIVDSMSNRTMSLFMKDGQNTQKKYPGFWMAKGY